MKIVKKSEQKGRMLMKKLGFVKIMSLVLCMVLLFSFMPTMTFAANSANFRAAKDILPGGQGVGFSDVPDSGGSVRGLEASGDSVCLRDSEWLKYDLSNLELGTYQLSIVAACKSPMTVTIMVNEETPLKKKVVKQTFDYNVYEETVIGEITITDPKSIMRIKNTGKNAGYISNIVLVSTEILEQKAALLNEERPYKMSYLPCIIEAENFDAGPSGVAYGDADEGNTGRAYRPDVDVDIWEDGDMRYVSMVSNDWMTYTVQCDIPGNYDLIMKLVDGMEGSKIRVFMDGYEVIRLVPDTALPIGTMKEAVAGTFNIGKGTHTLRIKCLDGDINLDYLRFRKSSAEGIDISDTLALRTWEESKEISDEDYVDAVRVINPVEREIYVDASASINGDGSESAPFNTIEAAKEYVKTINKNMSGDIVVNLKGDFKIDETLVFGVEDSGKDIYNVIYRGEDGASIHGGRKVTGWKQAEGSPLWQTKLEDVEGFRQLYIGENRGVPSRSEWMYRMKAGWEDPTTEDLNFEGFVLEGTDFPEDFSKPQDMEMVWLPSWRNVRMPVDDIVKDENGDYIVKFPQPYFKTIFTNSAAVDVAEHYYYFENAPEFLDRPGEYYFDKDTKVLSYYPFSYEDMNTIDCYIPETEMLVKFTGTDRDNKVKNITFEGIELKYGGWENPSTVGFSPVQADQLIDPENNTGSDFTNAGRSFGVRMVPAQISVDFAQNINFYGNKFTHLGSNALAFNNATNLCVVEGNVFDDISGTTMTFGDWTITMEDPLEAYTRKITVCNNLIRRAGVEYMTPIMAAYYVNKVTIDHNDIKDAPYSGISMNWGWGTSLPYATYNRVTNNAFNNGAYKLVDGAFVYFLSDNKGTIVSGNHFDTTHDWKGGIYTDQGTRFIRAFDNVFENCPKWFKSTVATNTDNVAYNNYSERTSCVSYPDLNSIAPAIGKVNGEWPDEAKAIIANAGIQDDYKAILDDYNARANLRNASVERQRYRDVDTYILGGNWIEGGEGVAYHEVMLNGENTANFSDPGEPSVSYSTNGVETLTILNTAEGEWTKHKFTVDKAGEYDISAWMGVASMIEKTAVTVEIDDKVIADTLVLEPNCVGWELADKVELCTVYLEPGEHIIKLEHAIGNYSLAGIGITEAGKEFKRNDGFNQQILDVLLSK